MKDASQHILELRQRVLVQIRDQMVRGVFAYEASPSRDSCGQPHEIQLLVGFLDGVVIDAELFRQFPDGRQRITGLHLAGQDHSCKLTDDLFINGGAGHVVDGKHEASPFFSWLHMRTMLLITVR